MKKVIKESVLRALIREAIREYSDALSQEQLSDDNVDAQLKDSTSVSQQNGEVQQQINPAPKEVLDIVEEVDNKSTDIFNGYDCLDLKFFQNIVALFPSILELFEVSFVMQEGCIIVGQENGVEELIKYKDSALIYRNEEQIPGKLIIIIIKVGAGSSVEIGGDNSDESGKESPDDKSAWAKDVRQAFIDIKPFGTGYWVGRAREAGWSEEKIQWYLKLFRDWKKRQGSNRKPANQIVTQPVDSGENEVNVKDILQNISEALKRDKAGQKGYYDIDVRIPDNMVKDGYVNWQPGQVYIPGYNGHPCRLCVSGITVSGKKCYASYYYDVLSGWFIKFDGWYLSKVV